MLIYILRANANHYQTLLPKADQVTPLYRKFNGEPLGDDAPTIPVEIRRRSALGQTVPRGDFPQLTSHVPVFSEHALEALRPLLAGNGEFIPLNCANCKEPYVAFNVTRVVDALDLPNCEVKHFSSGRLMRVLAYAFHAEKVRGLTIFKLPQFPLGSVYVTDAFERAVREKDLKGFDFQLVWDSERDVNAYLILCPYCMGYINEETTLCPHCAQDTTRDAPFELTLGEYHRMDRKQCPACERWILKLATTCPHCGKN